jgi:hypothetical protein
MDWWSSSCGFYKLIQDISIASKGQGLRKLSVTVVTIPACGGSTRAENYS